MKKILLMATLLTFLFAANGVSAVLFHDDIINGSYSVLKNSDVFEMYMNFETIYQPYDSETKEYYPDGERGAGTTISWELTLDFSEWQEPADDLSGDWLESWGASFREGEFETFSYARSSDEQGPTGNWSGVITSVNDADPDYLIDLNPEGPWYLSGSLTKEYYKSADGTYQSWGSLEGSVSNTAPVPEPSTVVLMSVGLIGLVGYSRRKRFLKNYN